MRQSQPCTDVAIRLFAHVSEQLRGVFKRVILRVRIDQHSRGIQLGCIGHLCEENQRKQEAAERKEGYCDGPPRTFSAKLFLPALSSSTLPLRSMLLFRSIMKSLS